MTNNEFNTALNIMKNKFGTDYQFALATSKNNVPSLRYVDTYFDGSDFYVVTYAKSQKVQEISQNTNVALCARKMHAFSGQAINIGHPLLPQNAEIRGKLIDVFSSWYFAHNNEDDENMCYLKITPTAGFFHNDGTGYKMDFANKTVITFPFIFDTVLTDD